MFASQDGFGDSALYEPDGVHPSTTGNVVLTPEAVRTLERARYLP